MSAGHGSCAQMIAPDNHLRPPSVLHRQSYNHRNGPEMVSKFNYDHFVHVKKNCPGKILGPPLGSGGPSKFIDHKMRYSWKLKFLLWIHFGHTFGLILGLKSTWHENRVHDGHFKKKVSSPTFYKVWSRSISFPYWSQMHPRCISDQSQMHLRSIPDAYWINPRLISDSFHIDPRLI